MPRITNRPFFSIDVLFIAIAVILGAALVSHLLVTALQALLF